MASLAIFLALLSGCAGPSEEATETGQGATSTEDVDDETIPPGSYVQRRGGSLRIYGVKSERNELTTVQGVVWAHGPLDASNSIAALGTNPCASYKLDYDHDVVTVTWESARAHLPDEAGDCRAVEGEYRLREPSPR